MSFKEFFLSLLSRKGFVLFVVVIMGCSSWLLHFVIEFTAIRQNTLTHSDLITHYFAVSIGAALYLFYTSKFNNQILSIIFFESMTMLSQIVMIWTTKPMIAVVCLFFSGFGIGTTIPTSYIIAKPFLKKLEWNGKINYLAYLTISIVVLLGTLIDFYFGVPALTIFLIILLVLLIAFLLLREDPNFLEGRKNPLRFYFRKKAIQYPVLLLSFFVGFFFINVYSTGILMLDVNNLLVNPSNFNRFVFVLFMTSFIVCFPTGILYDAIGRKWMILIGFYFKAAAFLAAAFFVDNIEVTLLIVFPILAGIGFTLSIFGSFLVFSLELAPKKFLVEHNGIAWIFFSFGMILAHAMNQALVSYLQSQQILLPVLMIFAYFTATIVIFQLKEPLPSKKELEWKKKLDHILVLSKSGLPLYSQSFKEKDLESDMILTGGAIVGISSLINEITQTSKLKVIRQEKYCIMLEQSSDLILAVMTTEELNIIRDKMIDFLIDFESFFKDLIKNWVGDSLVFSPAKRLVEKHFK